MALLVVAAALAYGMLAPSLRVSGAPVRTLTAAYNTSAHDLFASFAETPGNIVFSPYSIGTAMAMVMSGARGDTATEMAAALRHTLSRDAIDDANRDLLAAFNGYDSSFWPMSPSVRLKTANALLLRGHGDIVSPRYASLLKDKYQAQLFRDAGLDEVNGWVKRQTEGKIEKIVDRIEPDEVAAIVNAIYFKGMWQSAFRRNETHQSDFHLSRSARASVPTMHQTGEFAVLRRPGYWAIRLSYRNDALSMVVILPDDVDGAAVLARKLDAGTLADLFAALIGSKKAEIKVALPRFTARYRANLKAPFVKAGMRSAFALGLADFSGMTGTKVLAIGRVEHSAFIEVTEEGTEAAAATSAFMITSVPPSFVVDRPFLFYITERKTGAILFEGRISDPRLLP